MSGELELRAASGFVADDVHAEFPGLRLSWITLEASPGPSPRAVKQRLRTLSNRFTGGSVVAMRTQPIPHAYRSFFRQVGLDPDQVRVPIEEAAVARLLHGGFRSADLVSDALLLAVVETGVPVWAIDADRVDVSGLGIRVSGEGEHFGSGGYPVPPGRLVVADAGAVHALLFGALAPGHGVGPATSRVTAFAVGVDGVPEIHIEEALWIWGETMAAGRNG